MNEPKRLGPEHLRALLSLQAECYPEELHDDAASVLAALSAGHVIGVEVNGWIAGAAVVRPATWIYSVEVHPDAQRRGVGKRLLAACATGLPAVTVAVSQGGAALLGSAGFDRQASGLWVRAQIATGE